MIPGDSALGIQRSALSSQRSALHSSPELGVLVGKQMQEADLSPFAETEEIPDLRDLSSLIKHSRKREWNRFVFLLTYLKIFIVKFVVQC